MVVAAAFSGAGGANGTNGAGGGAVGAAADPNGVCARLIRRERNPMVSESPRVLLHFLGELRFGLL